MEPMIPTQHPTVHAGRFGSMWQQTNAPRHRQRDLVIASLLLCPDRAGHGADKTRRG